MTDIDWSKAPEGATHWGPYQATSNGSSWPEGFYRILESGLGYAWRDGRWSTPLQRSSLWRERLASLIALCDMPAPAWDGQGLPPVGTVCEFVADIFGWIVVEVTASTELGLCIKRQGSRGEGFIEEYLTNKAAATRLRPMPTAQQIEFAERQAAVEAMLALDTYPNGDAAGGLMSRRAFCEALLADGYRKQVTP